MPIIRSDIVDVYIFRCRPAADVEFLQLLRAGGTQAEQWHPIMGHIQEGETALASARREMAEEVGASPADLVGLWALEQVHPYFLPRQDAIMLSPRFAAQVPVNWQPQLNHEHSAFRWIAASKVRETFLWPGQQGAIGEILDHLLRPKSGLLEALEV